jgi:recombination protein RecA
VVLGTKTRVKVVKNKMAPPFREAEFEILYGTGVNWAGEIVDLGNEAGLIEKSGAYYKFKGDPIAQGRENACHLMLENPEAAEEIRTLLVERRKAENVAPTSGSASSADPNADAA